ncbi:phosphoribosylglycinamide formyltransferase [Rhodohalobacter sp. SW132]|uniref:phosphoribosylglycinamide formyltransferase n=1 Tax=Rhodohalobacter sp. SW132 TaxID=2293433 RepID=UPI000E22B14B|nr:phosphoribosylglycinamide formyltransferase [Rhodohalobacter sp. SW132]REL33107.1 phosphoribosylglycinamide formyltransferase [Rhodohalobacter sp. SW132]
MHKLLFFASGSGTNFQAVIDAVESGSLNTKIVGLITNREDAGAIHRAKDHNIPVEVIPFSNEDHYIPNLLKTVETYSPDLIVLAGYLKKIPDPLIETYRNRIINIHPSLLPKYGGKGFYGLNVHRAVIENRDPVSGCTVHFVNETYDDGAIIDQASVKVSGEDNPETLAKKILREEHKLLPESIKKILTQKHTQ